MSFGSFLKKAGHVVGTVGKYAAPALALTGVGAPLAGLIGAGSAALAKATSDNSGGVGGVLGDAAKFGLADYAGAKGIGALKDRMLPPPPGATMPAGGTTGAGAGGGLSGLLDKVKQMTGLGAPGGLNAKDLLAGGVAAYGAKQAHDAGSKADDLMNERLNMARQQYADTAPMRQAANAGVMSSLDRLGGKMLAPPDMSYLQDNANPFRKKFLAPQGA